MNIVQGKNRPALKRVHSGPQLSGSCCVVSSDLQADIESRLSYQKPAPALVRTEDSIF